MRTYWILWTYIGNYSDKVIKVEAQDSEHALEAATGFYSDDFQKKATVYVFDREPVLTKIPT